MRRYSWRHDGDERRGGDVVVVPPMMAECASKELQKSRCFLLSPLGRGRCNMAWHVYPVP